HTCASSLEVGQSVKLPVATQKAQPKFGGHVRGSTLFVAIINARRYPVPAGVPAPSYLTDYGAGCLVGFHSRASFCASAICSLVIRSAATCRVCIASLYPCAADNSNHLYACI